LNILITGAFGFVGTNLSRALAAAGKHQLIAPDLTEPFQLVAQSPPVYPVGCNPFGAEFYRHYSEFVSWDELHTLIGRNIDAIIHLAGKAHDTRNTAAEQEYFDINLGLTQKIFEFFLQSGAKKFIFFSSVKAAAENYLLQQFSKPATSNQQPATCNLQL
jgi:nucleoside-diphosphate-sugar epimerase